MKRILIANLGTSDFNYKGGTLKNNNLLNQFPNKNFVEILKEVNENYEKHKEFIKLPILEELFTELLPTDVILVYTKQNPTNEKDTFELLELAMKYFKNKNKFKFIEWEYSKNPTDFKELNNFYRKRVKKDLLNSINEIEKINISTTAGTPQMNDVLKIVCFDLIPKELLNCYQVIESETGKSKLSKNTTLNFINGIIIKSTWKTLGNNYDFKSLSELANKWADSITYTHEQKNILIHLSNYCNSLMYFDFYSARKIKNEYLLELSLSEDLLSFEPEQDKWKLIHFIDTLEVFINLEKWIDFAARNYAFSEFLSSFLLNKLFQNKFQFSIQNDKGRPTEEFIEFANKNNELIEFLTEKFNKAPEISKDRELSYPIKCYTYEFYSENNTISAILKCFADFNTEFRNKSHIAHGFGTITKEDFDKHLKVEFYKELRKEIDNTSSGNKFELIRDELLKFL